MLVNPTRSSSTITVSSYYSKCSVVAKSIRISTSPTIIVQRLSFLQYTDSGPSGTGKTNHTNFKPPFLHIANTLPSLSPASRKASQSASLLSPQQDQPWKSSYIPEPLRSWSGQQQSCTVKCCQSLLYKNSCHEQRPLSTSSCELMESGLVGSRRWVHLPLQINDSM